MNDKRTCSGCGAELRDTSSGKLCEACILKAALDVKATGTVEVSGSAARFWRPVAEKPGDRIGRYKLLEQIGEGGCGVVYSAEQEEPVRRQVALKVIKPGMDSKEVLARFEAERQALAMMDHPNIAKVLDAGATETGHPYFVMELVKGERITDYCDKARLTTRERLRLFVDICQAVQHAHQKGIIHRDIKPSNILVNVQDGRPQPKIIDFGIAKATAGQSLTDKTLFTALDQFIGTPAYMSPEQAEASGNDIDTRSDLYALGVLLYELLTGQTPFKTKELLARGLDEIRRVIREEDPPRPSTRLSTLAADEQTAIAQQRGAEPPKLIGSIRGDLDWIVMKTLEKERERRYESASALAADVQRHLSDEPVIARPPSQAYRLRKLVRRNKVAVGAGTAVVAALLTAVMVSSASLLRERAAMKTTRAVNALLMDDILRQGRSVHSVTIDSSHPNLTFRLALERAAKTVDGRFKDHPEELEAIDLAIGDAFVTSGDPAKALPHMLRGLELRRTRLGSKNPETLDAMNALAATYIAARMTTNAVPILQEILKLSGGQTDANARTVIPARNNLAYVYANSEDPRQVAEARRLLEQTVKAARSKPGTVNHETLNAMVNLAVCYRRLGQSDQVLPLLETARELSRTTLGPYDPDTLQITHNLATIYQETGDKREFAPKLFEEVLAGRTDTLGPDHPDTLTTLYALGQDWLTMTNFTNAEQVLRHGLDEAEKKKPHEWIIAAIQNRLGVALLSQHKDSEAERFLLDGYEGLKQQEAYIPHDARELVLKASNAVYRVYMRQGKTNELHAWQQKSKGS